MCDTCEHEEVLEVLNNLCTDFDDEWANDLQSGITEWVKEHGHVMEKPLVAIENIQSKVEGR